MVLWQSPDTPFMSCFYVSARLRVCSSRALSRLRALFCVGAWCSDPGTHVLSFGFVSGFGHSRSMFCLIVWACGWSSLGRALSCPRVLCVCGVACSSCFYRLREFMLCLVLCGTQLVFFIGCELTEALPAWSAVIWFLSGVDPLMCFQMSGLIKSLVAVRTLERFFSTVNFLVHFQFTICNTFTFMHLADAFIQSDLHCIQVTVLHFISSCFPWESNPWSWRC